MVTHAKFIVGTIAAVALTTAPCSLCGAGVRTTPGQQLIASVQALDTATVKMHISGMTCGSCATTARLALKKLDGVLDATVSLKDSLGVVRYDPRKVTPPQIAEHLTRLTGYGARVVNKPDSTARQPGRRAADPR
jgi:copper chaperone CopZ